MGDPYAILGVPRDATDEEIKAAYRNLAKKYHPDKYADTPLAEVAAEKMKEVNEAYDFIMDQRKRGTYSNSGSGYSSSGVSGFVDVRSLLNQGRIAEAEQILDGVEGNERSAEWHYLKGLIQFQRGFLEQAMFSLETACRMEPGNMEYSTAYNRLRMQQQGNFGGYNSSASMNTGSCNSCDICTGLMCADCCCKCSGGDYMRCC